MKIYPQHGFTVIELMVTVTVVAVLVTVAIPSFGSFISNNRLTAQANNFHSTLLLARSEAVKRNVQVTVCGTSNSTAINPCGVSSSGWADGWMMFIDANTDDQFNAGDTVLRSQEGWSGGSTLSSSGNVVNYTSDGRVGGGSTDFKFCDADNNDKYTRQLSISPLGNPKVTKSGTCP